MKSWKGKIIILITAGALAVVAVQGMGQGTKTDEFSEMFQTAVDTHRPEWSLSLEVMCMDFILSGPQ